MKDRLEGRSRPPEEVEWLPYADLMAGLMMVFLFIAVVYMRQVTVERDKIKDIVVAWDQTQEQVYEALREEFAADLDRWDAALDRTTLTMRFREPEVLFASQRAEITERFRAILRDFFPRYVERLEPFSHCPKDLDAPRGCIEEIRIEGHTSSEWSGSANATEAYFLNMELSQGRTRSVLQFCLGLVDPEKYPWISRTMAAVGFSSSHPVDENGAALTEPAQRESPERSRRVEFRVKTTVEKQLIRAITR